MGPCEQLARFQLEKRMNAKNSMNAQNPVVPPAVAAAIYRQVKADMLSALEAIRRAHPKAGEYLAQHLVFDDEKQTVMYTGDPRRLKITPGFVPDTWPDPFKAN